MTYLESFSNGSCFIEIYSDDLSKVVKLFDLSYSCVGLFREDFNASNLTLSQKYFDYFKGLLL